MGAIHCPLFGESLSAEICNDVFCNFSGAWILTADWTISGGAANYTPGSELTLQQDVTAYGPGVYRLSFDIVSGSGSLYATLTGDAGGVPGSVRTGVGTYSQDLTYPGNIARFRFTPSFGTSAVSIDNISLKRVY